MARKINFARNPLAANEMQQSIDISDKVRSLFTRGGSSGVHPTSKIKLEYLRPSPTQPRKTFDPVALEELKTSIQAHGIVEPLVVRLQDSHYEIVCGERRFRAAQALGLAEVPVNVLELSDEEAFTIGLHENIHRDSLTPVDEARAYRHLLDSGMASTQESVAQIVGISQSRVAQKLALLELPAEVQEKVVSKTKAAAGPGLTERHARVLRQVPSPEHQKKLAEQVLNEHLSVSQTEALVKDTVSAKNTDPERPRKIAGRKSSWVTIDNARYRSTSTGLSVEVTAGTLRAQVLALTKVLHILDKKVK